MAYVEGETLAQRVASRGPLPPEEATRVMREVAWALAYAHAQGVVHRDVKPENILLERGTERAMVTDFGIARADARGRRDEVGEVLGTPEYMSPEQASGEPVDGRSDLYALGAVDYFALSGKPPFTAPTTQAVLAQQITKPAPSVSANAAGFPGRSRESSINASRRIRAAVRQLEKRSQTRLRRRLDRLKSTCLCRFGSSSTGGGSWRHFVVMPAAITLIPLVRSACSRRLSHLAAPMLQVSSGHAVGALLALGPQRAARRVARFAFAPCSSAATGRRTSRWRSARATAAIVKSSLYEFGLQTPSVRERVMRAVSIGTVIGTGLGVLGGPLSRGRSAVAVLVRPPHGDERVRRRDQYSILNKQSGAACVAAPGAEVELSSGTCRVGFRL